MVVPAPIVKAFWSTLTLIGTRRVGGAARSLLPAYKDTVFCFPSSRDRTTEQQERGGGEESASGPLVVLTIDDGLCRNTDPSSSLVPDVLELLERHRATCTFFVCSKYTFSNESTREQAKELVERGHELGNHLAEDISGYYSKLGGDEFGRVLDETSALIDEVGNGAGRTCKWFRAPQGVLTKVMAAELSKRNLVHVLGDCYCDDWALTDAAWIAKTMDDQARDGSVLILHMPERGLRESSLGALRLLLARLDARGVRCVSLSEMERRRGLPSS